MRTNFVNNMINKVIRNEQTVKDNYKIVRPNTNKDTVTKDKMIALQQETIELLQENLAMCQEIIAKDEQMYEMQEQIIAALKERLAIYESEDEETNDNPFAVEHIEGYDVTEVKYVRDENGNWIAVDTQYEKN